MFAPCLTCVLLSNHSGFSSIYDENPADVMRYNDLCALTNPVHTDGCGSPREGLLPQSGIHVGAALAGSRTFTEDGTLTGGGETLVGAASPRAERSRADEARTESGFLAETKSSPEQPPRRITILCSFFAVRCIFFGGVLAGRRRLAGSGFLPEG